MNRKQRRRMAKRRRPGAPAATDRLLDEALEHHRAGRLDKAKALYEEVLSAKPDDAGALHFLGVLAHQQGDHEEAYRLISRAIAADGRQPAFHDHQGVALRWMGRTDEAEAAHRRAIELDPGFAAAYVNLGNTLAVRGRLEEAETAFRRGLELNPADADAHNNLGNTLRVRGKPTEAADAYRVALDLNPDFAKAHSNLGAILREFGDFQQAETACRRAIELDPGYADAYNNLGNVLMARERVEEGVECYRQAAALDPNSPLLLSNLGGGLTTLGRLDEAQTTFRRAIEMNPDCAEAHNGLGVVMLSQGKTEEALASYRKALAVKPDYVDVFYNMTNLGRVEFAAGELRRIGELLAENGLSGEAKAKLRFALAEHHAGRGEIDTAFDLYRQGNEARRKALAAAGRRYDGAMQQAMVGKRKALFGRDFFADRGDFGLPSEVPVFIVGMPRSGTTLIEQIAASHPLVHGAGELKDIAIAAASLSKVLDTEAPYPDCLAVMDGETSRRLAEDRLRRLDALAPGAARVIDKMPFNYLHLALIALLHPAARIIHCRRDARDLGLSCYLQNFTDSHPWTTRLEDIGHYFKAYESLMDHWRRVLPLKVMDIGYEDLVNDQEGQSRRLIDFLGLPWDDACLEFHNTRRAVRTASNWQVRQPIYSKSVGRWRLYEKFLDPLKRALES